MGYFSLTIDVPDPDAERLQDLMHELGAAGLEVRDHQTRQMPDVRAPAPGETIVVAFFPSEADAHEARGALAEALPRARAVLEPVPERDWSVEWRSRIKSVTVGRLWVGPPWLLAEAPAGKQTLVVEPKMAFGTGDHPTTRLCLEAVDDYLSAHPGGSVLDVGTGTGVLAIAARKLGASRVVGVDNDPTSVELAKETALQNGAGDLELSGKTLEAIDGRFQLVLANILANTLVELAPLIAPKVGDRLVLAGVLHGQEDEVAQAYEALGLRRRGLARIDEWVRLELERP